MSGRFCITSILGFSVAGLQEARAKNGKGLPASQISLQLLRRPFPPCLTSSKLHSSTHWRIHVGIFFKNLKRERSSFVWSLRIRMQRAPCSPWRALAPERSCSLPHKALSAGWINIGHQERPSTGLQMMFFTKEPRWEATWLAASFAIQAAHCDICGDGQSAFTGSARLLGHQEFYKFLFGYFPFLNFWGLGPSAVPLPSPSGNLRHIQSSLECSLGTMILRKGSHCDLFGLAIQITLPVSQDPGFQEQTSSKACLSPKSIVPHRQKYLWGPSQFLQAISSSLCTKTQNPLEIGCPRPGPHHLY